MNERVRLAKDVIAQLDAKKLAPSTGAYCIAFKDEACRVCAVGALAVACCGVKKVDRFGGADSTIHKEIARLAKCLRGSFSPKQLTVIEAAFEMKSTAPFSDSYDADPDSLAVAVRFGKKHPRSHENRLRAIMTNIIENDGEFRP